ncbi:MAG: aminotransferase class III-fold pyridoxal phosphate-dependent enzyme [Acidobacteria bacterium]|nr:aminotransferase class III-fold pyridoxal phosphate-dependent enzyme [Acidobacteriota bacterium]
MQLLNYKPQFTAETITQLAQELYGLTATAHPLPSERDQNFLLTTTDGKQFVFKLANALEDASLLEAQQQVLAFLSNHLSFCPQLVPTQSGAALTEIQSASDTRHLARLVTWLPGTPLGEVKYHSPELLQNLGQCLGQLDRALANFDHPALHRDFHWDLAQALRIVEEAEALIADDEMRRFVVQLKDDFVRDVVPLLPELRRGIIHNDANDYNVIVDAKTQRVTGLIDFGDMIHSFVVAELAIAIAYAILDKPDPLAVAAQLVKGYTAEYPLTEVELASLFGFVCMRLCQSVCIAAQQMKQQPDDKYLAISQRPIRNTLPKLAGIHSRFAEAVFRDAAGLIPIPRSERISDWLKSNEDAFASVMETDLRTEPSLVIDLSISSPLINGDTNENAEPKLTRRIFAAMTEAGVKVGVGRYDEARLLYTSPIFANNQRPTDERRMIHLGIDLFAEAGTAIHAPLAGTVHAFADNHAPLDYGPVILLRHETSEGEEFFTLYGHLSRTSLEGLNAGQAIAKGQRIATLGTPEVNGGWTPHLHFQIITDLLDAGTDFIGVCYARERKIWRSFSPDPNLILNIPASRFPAPAPNKAATLTTRRQRIGRNLSIGYREPVKVVRGWMQYLYDEEGRCYLDAYNNVPHVGHCHPRVVEAAREQYGILNTNTRYLHDAINEFAEKLCATLLPRLSVCYFVNSASEANELAIRLARAHTKQRDMIVLEAAYHGHTNALIDISPYKHDGPGGTGAPDWVHTAPIPDGYRGAYKYDDPNAGAKYAQPVADIIERLREQGRGVAGYIAESLPSVGGQIVLPPDYLAAVYQAVRAAGGVCIADDVQTGYGRIGTHFYGFEQQGVEPDIVVLGKPIGNGHPLGAVVTTPEIADAFDNGMEFFSTFGGSTVSCVIGKTVLEVVQEENLQEHAMRVGERMLAGMRPFVDRFPLVGDVRGSGLFLGVELVRDRETLEPADKEASYVANRMRDHGILLGTDGPFHNVVKIRPPMPFSEADADLLATTLEQVLIELS